MIDSLILEGDNTTPQINFNAGSGVFKMGGVAVPEDIRELSVPVMDWLKEYCGINRPSTELMLFFEYVNTATTKFLFTVCEKLNRYYVMGNKVKLTWKYVRGDLEMLELGEEIFEDFECPTEIIAVEQND